MPFLIGLLLGSAAGFLLGRGEGLVAGGLLGAMLGLVVQGVRNSQAKAAGAAPARALEDPLARRVRVLERRVEVLEQALGRAAQPATDGTLERTSGIEPQPGIGPVGVEPQPGVGSVGVEPQPGVGSVPIAAPLPAQPVAASAPAAQTVDAGVALPPRATADASQPPPMPRYGSAAARAPQSMASFEPNAHVAASPIVGDDRGAAPPRAPGESSGRLWAWITGGNALARIGAVVLLIGVGFLAKYAADRDFVPIEVRLAGVTLLAIALLLIGWRLRTSRRGYAVTLQGAGMGVLYLTVFAALARYQLVPPGAAFALLVLLVVATGVLAVRQDAMPLAVLGTLGGFAAPVLTSSGAGEHVVLFSYFALLNAGIFAIAWLRPWRALNVLGFACTVIVAAAWGAMRYTPDRFATTEPFLVLFFLFYAVIAVAYAWRRSLALRSPVDATLVFGTPIAVATLQAPLVARFEFGMAFSAIGIAIVYLALAALVRARREATLRLLVEAFAALGVVFATLAIPLAVDARWTSAAWALEGAALVWLGLRQARRPMRVAGLVLEVGAAAAFALQGALPETDGRPALALPFLNRECFGALLIALCAGFTAWRYDADPAPRTRAGTPVAAAALAWALLWWLGAGVHEVERFVAADLRVAGVVGWLALTAAVLLGAARVLRWPMPYLPTLAYLPALLAIAIGQGVPRAADGGHLLTGIAAGAWVASLLAGALVLRVLELESQASTRWPLGAMHAVLLWLVAFLAAEEAGWWMSRATEACAWRAAAFAAVPIAGVIALSRRRRDANSSSGRVDGVEPSAPGLAWTLRHWHATYATLGAGGLVAALWVGAALANLMCDGDARPLPFVPLANPLDVTLAGIAVATVAWWRGAGRAALAAVPRALLVGLAAASGFAWLTLSTVRTIHHATGVPFTPFDAWSSSAVQAALALVWSGAALGAMTIANRRGTRLGWSAGAALLGVVVVKLFLVDLAHAGTVARIVSFIGVGLLLLLVGYVAPVPAQRRDAVA